MHFVYWAVQLAIMFVILAAASPNLSAWEICEVLITIVILALSSLGE